MIFINWDTICSQYVYGIRIYGAIKVTAVK